MGFQEHTARQVFKIDFRYFLVISFVILIAMIWRYGSRTWLQKEFQQPNSPCKCDHRFTVHYMKPINGVLSSFLTNRCHVFLMKDKKHISCSNNSKIILVISSLYFLNKPKQYRSKILYCVLTFYTKISTKQMTH